MQRLRSKKNIIILSISLFIVSASLFFILSNQAQAQFGFEYTTALNLGTRDIRNIIMNIINIFLSFLGILAILIIMYGGYIYMTSGGDPQKVEKAKKILINGAVGLGIILLSWAIVILVFRIFGIGEPSSRIVPPGGYGPGSLGSGIIEGHYPARDQTDVARNTIITVTFKEVIDYNSIAESSSCSKVAGVVSCTKLKDDSPADGEADNLLIYKTYVGITDALEPTGVIFSCQEVLSNSVSGCKTFAFAPNNYLGNSNESIWYTVALKSGINKLVEGSQQPAFGAMGGYDWKFEVSSKLDLDPPKVASVFPFPDNNKDTFSSTHGSPAIWTMTLNSVPSTNVNAYPNNTLTVDPKSGSGIMIVTGQYGSLDDGCISIQKNTASNVRYWFYKTSDCTGVAPAPKDLTISSGVVGLNNGLTANVSAGAVGTVWRVQNVKSKKSADSFIFNKKGYQFISGNTNNGYKIAIGGGTITTIRDNILSAMSAMQSSQWLFSSSGANQILATSKSNSAQGNLANPTVSNSSILNFKLTTLGVNFSENNQVCSGSCDKPRNTVVQINFNEAVDSLSVGGIYSACQSDSDCASNGLGSCINNLCLGGEANFSYIKTRVKGASVGAGVSCSSDNDCYSGACMGTCSTSGRSCRKDDNCPNAEAGEVCNLSSTVCVGNYISGTYLQSNEYKTVELVTFDKCGVNSCGQDIYCLPPSANIEVMVDSATLKICNSNNDCKDQTYNTCNLATNTCQNSDGKNFPQANIYPADGVIDMSSNSLDGNSDSESIGPDGDGDAVPRENPDDYYNYNSKTGLGDNYLWSFWVTNQVDLIPPYIEATIPASNGDMDINGEISALFNKLLMSSTIVTGINNIYLNNPTTYPIGFWVNKIDQDTDNNTFADKTKVYINHSELQPTTAGYKPIIGSKIKDIYQNCYFPSEGPAGTCSSGIDMELRSCCNGTPTDTNSCI